MHGNVWEFVQDWWNHDYYDVSPSLDPQGPASGLRRVRRSGSWFRDPPDLRSANRGSNPPDDRVSGLIGFRVVRTVD